MKKLVFSGLIALALAVNVFAQTGSAPKAQLLEKVTAKPGELLISYEKWRLPNGLTLFIHEDHSDPMVHVEVTYHVGSAREAIGKSGFAHFFEHMMFQGSENVGDEQHFKLVQTAGGTMNGTTNHDRTNYYQTVPKNYLETMLWLESDRMGFLLDAVTQKKFEVQRSTVKNEKDQRMTNVPYGMVDELKGQILYPEGHPYSWPVIGYVEHLDAVGVEDLKNFFMRWYGPNNASIVIAGDVKAEEVVKMVEKYFGSISKGPDVRKQRVDPVVLADNIYKNYPDRVYLPLRKFVYPTVQAYHNDEPALDLLGQILGSGSNSIFYKNFVKSEKALYAGAEHGVPFGNELAGEFSIDVYSYPGGEVDVEALVKKTLNDFDAKGVSDEDLARAKGSLESLISRSIQTVAGKASILSTFYYMLGDKKWNIDNELTRYQKVTKDDVMRVFRQYIKDKPAAIVYVYPANTNAAASNEEKETASNLTSDNKQTELEYRGLSYKKPVDNFDRKKAPEIGPAPSPVVPEIYESSLSNGIKIYGTEYTEAPLVSIFLTIKGGNRAINDPSKAGLATLTASLMTEATQNYTAEQFENETQKLGTSINISSDAENTYITVSTFKKNLDKTIELLEERLLRPKFTNEDFKLIQRQLGQAINAQKFDAPGLANRAFLKQLYGAKSIIAEPSNGTIKTIKSFGLKDVQAFYDKFYAPELTTVLVVGDVKKDEILPKLDFLNKWSKKNVTLPNLTVNAPAIQNTQIYLVDKYKASQSEIRVGYLAMPYDYNGKFFKSQILNFPLSGNFNSRINQNIREDKGYTYGVGGGFNGSEIPGPFVIACGVKAEATDSALKEIFFELNKYRQSGITDEELEFTKKAMRSGDALRYESMFQKAMFIRNIAEKKLPRNYIDQQNEILSNMTKEEINLLINEVIPTDKMVIIIVGDKDKIAPSLNKLGYKITEIKMD
jgi:zinc protease